jgi:hypothetical protein
MSWTRRCDIFRATDDKWYLILGNHEYSEDDKDCSCYGPFEDEDAAQDELFKRGSPGYKRPAPYKLKKVAAGHYASYVLRGGRSYKLSVQMDGTGRWQGFVERDDTHGAVNFTSLTFTKKATERELFDIFDKYVKEI